MEVEETRRGERAAENGAEATPLQQLVPVQAVWIGKLESAAPVNRNSRVQPKLTKTDFSKRPGLGGTALLNRLDYRSRRERAGICVVKADQDLICRVLQPRVGLMQLASRLAR
jgi:hypothetical protein